MSVLPIPDVMKDNIYEITPELFSCRGIRFILLDIDNTVAPYTIQEASPQMKSWVSEMRNAGLELFILSNNRGDRPERFAAALGLPYRKRARKPWRKTALAVMAERGYTPKETAFIGDQIYTDTACARWCGAFAVLVRPIELSNPWLKIRYRLEFPFRLSYQWREHHDKNRKNTK